MSKIGKKNHAENVRDRRNRLRAAHKQRMKNPSGKSRYAHKVLNGGNGGGPQDDRPAIVLSSAVEQMKPPVNPNNYWGW